MTVREGYKEIAIGGRTDFQEDDKPQVIIEVDLEETPDQEQPVEQVKQETKVEDKPREQRQSRAQKRIRQLNQEKNEAFALLDKERKEKDDLRKQLSEGNRSNQSALKAQLETTVQVLTNQLREAIKNGDAEATVTLQDDLINAKIELVGIAKSVEAPVVVKEPESPKQQQIPERAMEWIDEHPEFKTDEEFYTATIVNNNKLIKEGWDVESDDFYDELDKRLSKRFPEMFGIVEKKDVKLSENKKQSLEDDSEYEPKDVKTQTRSESSKVRTTEQVVAGSSRHSSAITIQPNKKASVTLSPADVAQAERWGLTLEQMARRIAHSEKNKRADGYVPINMDRH